MVLPLAKRLLKGQFDAPLSHMARSELVINIRNNTEMGNKLFVGGLSWDATEDDLRDLFGETGESGYNLLSRNTRPFNLTGSPAISVPCGFTRMGLPIGLQLTGRLFDEATVFRAAHAYEQATDWHMIRPTI